MSTRTTGSGLEGIFLNYDKDGSGRIDRLEFTQAVEEMGFADYANDLFDAKRVRTASCALQTDVATARSMCAEGVQAKIHRSVKVWSLYLDLEENLGAVGGGGCGCGGS